MIDPTRLYSALLNTGLQSKDNALYQVIHDIIGNLALISNQTNTSSGGSTGSQGIQGIQGQQGIPGRDGDDGEDSIFFLR